MTKISYLVRARQKKGFIVVIWQKLIILYKSDRKKCYLLGIWRKNGYLVGIWQKNGYLVRISRESARISPNPTR